MAIAGSGVAAIACSGSSSLLTGLKENWPTILVEVMQTVLQVKSPSSTYSYSGTAAIEMYAFNSSNNTYNTDSKQTASPKLNIEVVTENGTNGQHGYIQFTIKSPITVGGVTVNDLVFTTYYDQNSGKIDPDGKSYLTGGTCTYNGKANTAINAACFEGSVNASQLQLTNIYLQVGDKVFMGKFTGTSKTVEQ